MKFNKTTNEFRLEKQNININQHKYNIDGNFHLKDSAGFNLHVITKAVPYKEILQLLTDRIRNKLNDLGIEKPMNAEADLRACWNTLRNLRL